MPANYGAISDKNRNKKGILVLAEVSDSFAIKTPASDASAITTAVNLGELNESSVDQQTSKTEIKNEAGVIKYSDFEYTLTTTGTLMERDKLKLDFLSHGCKGKYYLEYKYLGLVDGKHQEMFKFVQVTPKHSVKLPGGATSMKYESTAIFPDSTISLTSTTLGTIETALGITIYCTGVAITALQGYVLKETTAS